MSSQSFFESLARRCAAHPWRTLGLWAVALIAAVALTGLLLGGALTSDGNFTNEPDSAKADRLISQRLQLPDNVTELVVVRSTEYTVDDPEFKQQVDGLAETIMALGSDVVQGVAPYTMAPDPSLVSVDRHATVMPVTMAGDLAQAEAHVAELEGVVHRVVAEGAPFEALLTGDASISRAFSEIGESDLRTGEMFGIGVALIILVLVFGALLAAGIPLVLAVVSIVVALGLAAVAGQVVDLSTFIANMVTMIGLAMGIDYSLFIISRYREERGNGLDKADAIGRTGATAGRAVLFSGTCVILALAGLLLVPSAVFHSMALGAMLAVFAAVAGALTLLPAVLGLLGDRVNSPRVPFLKSGRPEAHATDRDIWHRVAHGVMRHPVISLALSCAVLLFCAGFYLQLEEGSVGVDSLPGRLESRQAFEVLATEFPASLLSNVVVAVDGDTGDPAVAAAVASLTERMNADADFQNAAVAHTSPAGDLTVIQAAEAAGLSQEEAGAAVARLRDEYLPAAFAATGARAYVTGPAAYVVDYLATIDYYTPWVFLFVIGFSFVFLMAAFRSIVVPAKAILMNLLSVGAAYGLLVLVFQKGWGADLLGLTQVDYIEGWIPLFLFAILFGTSMDYHVFLLSRIREHFDETGDNTESVAFGLSSTARIITGAAVIMVAVFAGFAAGELVMFQQLGFGLAVAVLLDATIVRTVLVPAAMKLLGDANWWLPSWLSWMPDLRVEPRPVPVPAVASGLPAAPAPTPTAQLRTPGRSPRIEPLGVPRPQTDSGCSD